MTQGTCSIGEEGEDDPCDVAGGSCLKLKRHLRQGSILKRTSAGGPSTASGLFASDGRENLDCTCQAIPGSTACSSFGQRVVRWERI